MSKVGSIYGENLAYGTYEAKDTLLTLAIDDGVASRGHRKNMFKPDFQRIGICEGSHSSYFQMVDIIYEGTVDSNKVWKLNYTAEQEKEDSNQSTGPPPTVNLAEGTPCSMIGTLRPTCAPGFCCGAARAPGATFDTQIETCQKEGTTTYIKKNDPIFNIATGYRSGDETWVFACIVHAQRLVGAATAFIALASSI